MDASDNDVLLSVISCILYDYYRNDYDNSDDDSDDEEDSEYEKIEREQNKKKNGVVMFDFQVDGMSTHFQYIVCYTGITLEKANDVLKIFFDAHNNTVVDNNMVFDIIREIDHIMKRLGAVCIRLTPHIVPDFELDLYRPWVIPV